jgi:hypothetical protein
MTAVTIRPTFSKDTRPSNGLEAIADDLIADKHEVHYVVGIVTWAGGSIDLDGAITPAVKFLGIEPLTGDLAESAKTVLDSARKARGLGRMDDNLPPREEMLFDFDGDGHPTISRGDGEPETRLGPDGEREVPEASGEEILAEREEAKAAGVPAPQFSGGDE